MKMIFSLALVGATLCASAACGAESLLQNGSFESPKVTGKVRHLDGGHPAKAEGENSWAEIVDKKDETGGKLTMGITSEIARTGTQSLYVDFEGLSASSQTASITTALIPIQANTAYRVSIWGRIDRQRPLSLDERRPSMWVGAAFFQADSKTVAGDPVEGVTMIPGVVTPGYKRPLTFLSTRWSPFAAEFETPAGTSFVQITWSWVIPKDQGLTDGVVYWDDASMTLANPPTQPAATPASGSQPAGAASK